MTQRLSLALLRDGELPDDDFVRLPGLFRYWEISEVVTNATAYRVEEAGELADRTRVFAVFVRAPRRIESGIGVPIALTIDDDGAAFRGHVVWLDQDEPKLLAVVPAGGPDETAGLARLRELLVEAGPAVDDLSTGTPGVAPAPEAAP